MNVSFDGECTCCSSPQKAKLEIGDYSNSEVKISISSHTGGNEELILINKCAINQIRAVLKAFE